VSGFWPVGILSFGISDHTRNYRELKLSIDLFKVKAHDKDIYNNRADYLASIAHQDIDNLILDINYHNIESIKWIPTWNNIVIEKIFGNSLR
jgi:hypothetical protein